MLRHYLSDKNLVTYLELVEPDQEKIYQTMYYLQNGTCFCINNTRYCKLHYYCNATQDYFKLAKKKPKRFYSKIIDNDNKTTNAQVKATVENVSSYNQMICMSDLMFSLRL